ncbi:MAG: hypothetical protein EXX96DRAFT_643928 [Benjaminiella poitrasii]|nr:MAG: hypothetical protein EXX96DRAFT_643928 [Benjaminiella poitrasii]
MHRRRSFEGDSNIMAKHSNNNFPTPISSVSAQVVPYPRGGRQIGQTISVDDMNITLRRSNSIERQQKQYRQTEAAAAAITTTATAAAAATTTATTTAITSAATPRKRSNEVHANHKLLLLDHALHTTSVATEIQKYYYQQQNEKIKSTANKTKNGSCTNEKVSFNPFKFLDQDFDRMDGIVNRDYYKGSPAPSLGYESLETWAPPDSWGVQPASVTSASASIADEEQQDYDDYSIAVRDKWNIPKKNVNMSKYNLVMKRHNIERVLGMTERPLQIQKILQEQMGYMEDDTIEDCSYLVRFQIMPNITHSIAQEESAKDFGQHVDLQSRSLATIPIYLYKHVSRIVSLDVSRNLQIELPLDFIQMCTNLRQLWLANNEYSTLPHSTQSIVSLEHLNISGNRLRDLDHAHLDELKALRTLRAINNKLESLPASFATSFKHLTTLFISNNSFTKFPMVICEITSLAYLDISFNKIQAFPEEISHLTNLVGLFAIANRITGALPSSFMCLQKLQELDIRQNLITDLDVVSHLSKLEVLLVDYNSTSIVNFEIKGLRQLKMYKNHLTQFNLSCSTTNSLAELNLSCCKLSSLPENVFNNTQNLERLVLDSNTLSTLPSSIGALKKLVKLSVQNNNLDALPYEIGKLTELRVLDAQKNNLKSLPKEIWLCASLQTLNCSSNLLESFPEPLPAIETNTTTMTTMMSVSDNNNNINSSMLSLSGTAGQQNASKRLEPSSSSLSLTPHPLSTAVSTPPAPNFNPPSFFASPRNHPPPLSLSLRQLLLGDNRLTDDVWSPLSLFIELRTLNLSFNDLYEIPPEGLCHQHLYELYLSGNQLTSLPADDIERLQYLRVLAVNGNKLQTLPAEIGKLRKLLVLDVGNNVLKYNIANWPYDWNWNWNLGLNALTRLRMLGLMDITILGVSTPEEFHDRRVRTSPSEVNSMAYGVADWLGPSDHLSTWDLVMPRFRGKEDECIFALFDGSKHPKSGCRLTKHLNDSFVTQFTKELGAIKSDDTIVCAIRRVFLGLQQNLGTQPFDKDGAAAAVCYFSGTKLYVANVGDALAVISRNNGQAYEVTQKHIPLNPSEVSRIRTAGGYVSNSGLLNNELNVSRSFGHFHLIPVVNCNPYVSTIDLAETDEFLIMASRGLWDKMTYQTAVDIARTEKDDLMAAAQKLRDFAITYGATDNLMVMVVGVGDLFDRRGHRQRYLNTNRYNNRGNNLLMLGQPRSTSDGLLSDDGLLMKSSNKRRGKEEIPGDSTLARLEREVAPPVSQLALVFTDIKSSTQFWETQPENMRAGIKIHDAIMRRTLRSVGGYEVKTEGDAFMVCFKNITAALLWCFTVQLQLLEADWPAGILDTEEGREIEKDGVVIYRGLSVRMGIHWGAPVSERNPITQRMDYFGPVVNKASRICNAADGGQICVSSDVIAALRNFPSMFNDGNAQTDATQTANTLQGTPSYANNDIDAFPVSRDLVQLKQLGFHVVELGERRLKGLETPEALSLVYSKQLLGRIEIDKSQIIAVTADNPSETPTHRMSVPSSLEASPSLVASNTTTAVVLDSKNTSPGGDYLTAKPLILPSFTTSSSSPTTAAAPKRTIDPNLVCAMSNMAIRLERLTSGNVLSQQKAGSTIQSQYILQEGSETDNKHTVSTATSGIGQMLDKHIRQDANDEELVILMENCVTRVEV